jgi:hypothetical protein
MTGEKIIVGVLIVIIIILLYIVYNDHTIINTSKITSNIDGLDYRVHNSFNKSPENSSLEGKQHASNVISILNNKAIELLRYLKNNSNKTHTSHTQINRLLKYYNPDNIVENSPKNMSGDTSYTYNDGSTIAICLRERNSKVLKEPDIYNIHDMNTLTFVFLHELAHISVPFPGHPPEFWIAFRNILLDAEKINIIDIIDYQKYPAKYCGMVIDSNPVMIF